MLSDQDYHWNMPISRSALAPLSSVRFLVALRVALYHFSWWKDDTGHWWRGLLATPISVSYFFVSSGFLLAYNYAERSDQGQMDATRFLLGRVARLLPVYFLGLLVALPILVQAGGFSAGKATVTALLLQAWSPSTAVYWNAPAWALSNLAFFYLSLPLVLKLTRSATKSACLLIGGAAWLVSIGLGLLYIYVNPDGLQHIDKHSIGFWLYVLKFNPLARLPEFIVGVMVGRLFLLTGGFERRTSSIVFTISTLVLLGVLLVGLMIPYPVINSGLLAPVLALVISSLASGGLAADFFNQRWFVLMGQSSYCLYMLHVPLWHMGYRRPFPSWNVALVFIIMLVSLALYEWVEKPASAALKSLLLPSAKPPALAVASQ
jgi:peptidoglycan/LPS O-acetylase OafA/YrhL